jgi:hypothetical protein
MRPASTLQHRAALGGKWTLLLRGEGGPAALACQFTSSMSGVEPAQTSRPLIIKAAPPRSADCIRIEEPRREGDARRATAPTNNSSRKTCIAATQLPSRGAPIIGMFT